MRNLRCDILWERHGVWCQGRITGTRLIDHDGRVREGDFLIHEDGSYSHSSGDEDVTETIEGSDLVITRSLQNWHTHLPMTLNRSMGEGLALMDWLQTSIFPSERNLTPELASIGTRASVAEMISGGTTFACDMYHFPGSIAPVVAENLALEGLFVALRQTGHLLKKASRIVVMPSRSWTL